MLRPSHAGLPNAVTARLDRVLSARPRDAGPLTITFATADFAALLDNWLAHAALAGETAPLVIALDDGLSQSLLRAGVPAIAHRSNGTLADLWIVRAACFEYLARRGADFIHSDLDAIWLRDPRPLCFADAGLDLVFSQGTNYPADIWRQWGFVLCCGLFAARGSRATAEFFSAVRAATTRVGDDQVVVNHLLAQGQLAWDKNGASGETRSIRGQPFMTWRRMLKGFSATMDLRVGMLPHHLVPRLPDDTPGAYVRHPVGPGTPAAKASLLRGLGCWLDDASP